MKIGDEVYSRQIGVPAVGKIIKIISMSEFETAMTLIGRQKDFRAYFDVWSQYYTIGKDTQIAFVEFIEAITGINYTVFKNLYGDLDIDIYKDLINCNRWAYPLQDLEKIDALFGDLTFSDSGV